MVVGAIEKGGKALLDGAKKLSSKLHEGVSFLASKAKGLSNKIGDLWNKGKTKVKNNFIEADKAFRYAMKNMGEYVPKFGGGPIPVMEGASKIPSGGKNLLKDAYQYVKDTGEKAFGSGERDVVKKDSRANVPKENVGIVQSRINIANGPTRFSSSKNASFEHVLDRHFDPLKNAGNFTISPEELKSILQAKETVKVPVQVMEQSGNYSRIINIGKEIGTIKPSIPNVGGQGTNYMMVITDKGGNLVTAYPVPKL